MFRAADFETLGPHPSCMGSETFSNGLLSSAGGIHDVQIQILHRSLEGQRVSSRRERHQML